VNNYPFTTREMVIGHLRLEEGTSGQIMDTPGLLLREDDGYNAMERLTLAAVEHLPTSLVFVSDLSGTAGMKSTLEEQLIVRVHLRRLAKERGAPWLDVITKADLGFDEPGAREARDVLLSEGAVLVSSLEDGDEAQMEALLSWLKRTMGEEAEKERDLSNVEATVHE